MLKFLILLLAVTGAQAEPQRVEGFGRVVFAHNTHTSATVQRGRDFRGLSGAFMTAAWWAPGQTKDNRLEWETAPCPEKEDTVFSFLGASSPLPPGIARGPELKLYIDGEYILTFSIGWQRDWNWSGNGVRLQYRAVRNEFGFWGRQRQFEIEGNSGVYELSVPASRISKGRPVVLKAVLQPFERWPNGWFMVKDRKDVLDPTTSLRDEVTQLRNDVNRLSELVHVLATRQYAEASGQDRFEHFTVYTNGYKHLHPADIIPMRDGSMLLTAREATEHVARDGDMIVLRSSDGRNWSKISRLGIPGLDEREGCGIELPDGTLLMAVYYNSLYRDDDEYEQQWNSKVKLGAGKQYLGFYTVTSKDRGLTWSEPNFARTDGMPFSDTEGPADAPVLMPDGTILLPLMAYNVQGDRKNFASVLFRSSDQGKSWQYFSTIANDPGGKLGQFAEPGLVRLKSGALLAAMRNTTGHVWLAKSIDHGRTWSEPRKSPMVGHPADLIQLSDGRLLCTYGVREPYHGIPGGVRASYSRDDGETWDLDNDVQVRADFVNWDVGYPESRQLADGRVLTVYYYNVFGRYFLGGSLWKP